MKVALLTKCGFRISYLADLSSQELHEALMLQKDEKTRLQHIINTLIIYMHQFQPEKFENLLDDSFEAWPSDQVLNEIIFPFLQKARLLSEGKRLTEEHFVVTILRSKIIRCIENVSSKPNSLGKKILLFLPAPSQLDLLLLHSKYLLKKNGFTVFYMGDDVTIDNLKDAVQVLLPDYVLTYLPQRVLFNTAELALMMSDLIPNATLIIIQNPRDKFPKINMQNVQQLDYSEARASYRNLN